MNKAGLYILAVTWGLRNRPPNFEVPSLDFIYFIKKTFGALYFGFRCVQMPQHEDVVLRLYRRLPETPLPNLYWVGGLFTAFWALGALDLCPFWIKHDQNWGGSWIFSNKIEEIVWKSDIFPNFWGVGEPKVSHVGRFSSTDGDPVCGHQLPIETARCLSQQGDRIWGKKRRLELSPLFWFVDWNK